MPKNENLVIVESPAKAKTIEKFLGDGYNVEASMGHLIDLPKSQLGVNIEEKFDPKYITIRGKGKFLQNLRKEAKKSKSVLLATDPDREGEAISWHLANALKIDKDSKCRIEFNEITANAIEDALKNPRLIDKDKVDAQQARRLLDRLVGYKLSPLLWDKVKRGLSAGRVQTVAVRIICEREDEIRAFKPEEYWTIENKVQVKEKRAFIAKLFKIEEEKYKINNEQEAKKVESELKKEELIIDKIKEGTRKRNPSAPFTTSTLQQQAYNYLNFSAKKTMFLAQQLYEGLEIGEEGNIGLITYMRTDSTRIAKEAKNHLRDYIKHRYGDRFSAKKVRQFAKSKKAQDAHEAIRPTGVDRSPRKLKEYLSKDQYKLYKLIWQRFVASQMSAAIYKTLRVDIKGDKYWLRANGSQKIFPGFLKVDQSKKGKEDELLPDLKEGESVDLKEILAEQHFTNPPPRYTEAKLVKTLEKKGIGRPSTYATIVATIQNRGYVEGENKRFKPTELGEIVIELLVEYFTNVTDVKFTAELEDKLDKIEAGEADWRKVLAEFYFPFAKRLEDAKENMAEVEIEDEVTDEVCEKCGANMVIKRGRYGKFLACPNFPACKNTKALVEKMGVKCPECNDGDIIKRKSKKNRVFYGCSNYPNCEFVTWHKPTNETCPECNLFLVKKETKKESKLYCIDKECNYEKEI